MVVYPLSVTEDCIVRWAVRLVPVAAAALIVLMGAISLASTPA